MNDRCQTSKFWNRRKALLTSSILHFAFCILIFFILVTSCANPDEKESIAVQIEQLTQEKIQLQKQIEQSEKENKQLKQQLQVLSGLPKEVKLENLNRLDNIKIGRYTGFFDKDKDKDSKKEKLIVYIQPFDEHGDAIKAVGTADVQLWNLNKTSGEALLGQWKVESSELQKLWFATMLTINYRLTFDVANIVENMEEPLTVKVTFTDYLTGKVFKEQKAVKAP
jgi:cell division protein FtsB